MVDARLAQDPRSVFERFQDRQQRDEQFSQNMSKVMYGSYGVASATSNANTGTTRSSSLCRSGNTVRSRSPGLAAGAALTIGPSTTTAESQIVDNRNACRAMAEKSRGTECPFDDHRAFATSGESATGSRAAVPPRPEQASAALQAAREQARQNRDLQQKIGAGSPFDAPGIAYVAAAGKAKQGLLPASTGSFADAQEEAARNKSRMRGTSDLISGDYIPAGPAGASAFAADAAARRVRGVGAGKYVPQEDLLPEANFALAYQGGSLSQMTSEKAAYMNAHVLQERNRDRNSALRVHFG